MKINTSSNLHKNPAEECAKNRDFRVFSRILHVVAQVSHVFAQMLHVFAHFAQQRATNARKRATFAQTRAKLAQQRATSVKIRENTQNNTVLDEFLRRISKTYQFIPPHPRSNIGFGFI